MKSSDKIITDLAVLGNAVRYLSAEQEEFPKEFTKQEIENFKDLIQTVNIYNPWYTPEMVRKALSGIALVLEKKVLEDWVSHYQFQENEKLVAVIMASNIPLVGFHDLLSVLVSGNKALVKMSKEDNKLLPALLGLLFNLDESYKSLIQFSDEKIKGFDAVIATGSDNTSRYFQDYFGAYPNIIRKNRTSIAIIPEDVNEDELKLLADDIFDFFGLGCRNVSKCFFPEKFDLNRLFEALYHKHDVINHNKYANNYDYNRAIHLMNQEEMLDNGFLLLKESRELFSPLGMLYYERYDNQESFQAFEKKYEDKIQAVIARDRVPFGQGQKPGLMDYADGVDVMQFLSELK